MSFKAKSSNQPTPTHVRWAANNKDKFGESFEIVLVLVNPEWRTLTFFAKEFKVNFKLDSDESFLAKRDELYKSFKRGYVFASLKDSSTIEPLNYEVDIDLEAKPESQGGRKYNLGKNRIDIEPSNLSTEEKTD